MVAVGYAAGYLLLREYSNSHWALYSGLRLSLLLLVPYRYWSALVVGELIPLSYVSYQCLDSFGWAWSAAMLVPPIGVAMPVVHWFRSRQKIFVAKAATDINMLLMCALLLSVLWALVNMAAFWLGATPPGAPPDQYGPVLGRFFLGGYLGILTVVPIVLLVREELQLVTARQLWPRLAGSRLALETVSLVLPSLALLVWMATSASGDAGQVARVAMFLPVAWLALRHGWRGAAIGGGAASVAVALTTPAIYDSGTLQAQVFIAFTITTMLLLGGRIASLKDWDRSDRMDTRLALAMAQRTVHLGEMQLRQTSIAIEQLSHTVRATQEQLLRRLRFLVPSTDDRGYYRQAVVTQHQMYRLADTVYPLNWGERGLPAALREGSIPRSLDEAGIGYWCDIRGRGLSMLSSGLHLTLYRLACEAIAHVCAERNVGRIDVRLRGGLTHGRQWAVLRVDGYFEGYSGQVNWDGLLPLLGGTGIGIAAIQDRAKVFEGRARSRSMRHSRRVSLMVLEARDTVSDC